MSKLVVYKQQLQKVEEKLEKSNINRQYTYFVMKDNPKEYDILVRLKEQLLQRKQQKLENKKYKLESKIKKLSE